MNRVFENIIKEQITLNEHSINVTGRTSVHNFEKTLSEHLENVSPWNVVFACKITEICDAGPQNQSEGSIF